jgi:hypothetical protein
MWQVTTKKMQIHNTVYSVSLPKAGKGHSQFLICDTKTLFHAQNHLKWYIKLPPDYMYTVPIKHKWILCSDLGPILKMSHYVCTKIWNSSSSKHFRYGVLNPKFHISICDIEFRVNWNFNNNITQVLFYVVRIQINVSLTQCLTHMNILGERKQTSIPQ